MSADTNKMEVGCQLNPVSKTLDQDRMDRFEKFVRVLVTEGEETEEPTTIHTDPEKAKSMGMERPMAS